MPYERGQIIESPHYRKQARLTRKFRKEADEEAKLEAIDRPQLLQGYEPLHFRYHKGPWGTCDRIRHYHGNVRIA